MVKESLEPIFPVCFTVQPSQISNPYVFRIDDCLTFQMTQLHHGIQ